MDTGRLFHFLLLATFLTAPSASAEDLRDPMRPPGHEARKQAPAPTQTKQFERHWRLQSTLIAGNRRNAVINGHLVAPGERVHGARVLRIERDRVEIDDRGQRVLLQQHNPVRKDRRKDGESCARISRP